MVMDNLTNFEFLSCMCVFEQWHYTSTF